MGDIAGLLVNGDRAGVGDGVGVDDTTGDDTAGGVAGSEGVADGALEQPTESIVASSTGALRSRRPLWSITKKRLRQPSGV